MKTFTEFMNEVYDPDVQGRSQITKQGEGGRIARKRTLTDPERKRTKAVGGGKTEIVKQKPRKDIGQSNPKMGPSGRQQQPTQERGTAGVSGKEAQRKAYRERKAREAGAKTKTASQLLTKKEPKKVDPGYKPQKASNKTQKERDVIRNKGEKALRDIRLQSTGKKSEKDLKHSVTKKEGIRRKKSEKK